VQQAGVGDKFHACRFGGVDHVLVLGRALAHFAGGDEQQLFHAAQRGSKGGLIGVIRLTNHNTLVA
jgi:hypothetical protein